MPAVVVVTLVFVGLLSAALVFYLAWIAALLARINDTLSKVTFGVRAIAARTEPIKPLVVDMNTNLTAVAGALEGLVPAPAQRDRVA